MINILGPTLLAGLKIIGIAAVLLFAAPRTAEAGAKYKSSTVVDFEGSLVEGKSRKPYSAYLTQQKENAFGELHRWTPDLDKSFIDEKRKLERSL